jgi:hypothetical protein
VRNTKQAFNPNLCELQNSSFLFSPAQGVQSRSVISASSANIQLASVCVDYESSVSVAPVSAVVPPWHFRSLVQWSHNAVRSVLLPCYEAVELLLLLLLLWPTDCSSNCGIGYTYLVRHPTLVFFSQNVLLSHRENVISYFRHGLIQCFPTICTLELFGIGKNWTQD